MVKAKIRRVQQVLSQELGSDSIASSKNEKIAYSHDMAQITGTMRTAANRVLFSMTPDLIVMPRNTEDVQKVVRHAFAEGIHVVPRGGASWGFGSVVPVQGGIVLDLAYMDQILEFNREKITVRVQAGAKCQLLIDFLERHGLTLNTCSLNAPYSTVGGWLASCVLGIGTYKYGSAAQSVLGLKIVTPNGDLIETPSPSSFGTGYNLNWLYMGCEGTLGIITEAELLVYPKPEAIVATAYSFDSVKTAQSALVSVLKSEAVPYFAEIMDAGYITAIKSLGEKVPEVGAIMVLAFEGEKARVDRELKLVTDLLSKFVKDKKALEIQAEGKALWEERYNGPRIQRAGPSAIFQPIVLPLAKLADLVEFTEYLGEAYRLRVGVDAHLIAHNSLLATAYFLVDERRKGNYITSLPVVKDLIDEAIDLGGRTYGSGLWNFFYLRYSTGQAAVEAMRRIKKALDKEGILNPSKTCSVKPKLRIPLVSIEDSAKFPLSSIIYNTFLWIASFIIKIVRGIINALYWRK